MLENNLKQSKVFLFVLRLLMGWLFFYAGIIKVLNPNWSAAEYMEGAKTFTSFYNWLAQSDFLPVLNLINEWGLIILGVSLILGLFVRWSAPLGALLMLLYYFPVLEFPYIGHHSFLVEEHIIYAFVLIFLAAVRAGRFWGIDGLFKKSV